LLVNRTTVFPDVGGFKADSFDHLIGLEITCPGLDARWRHLVINAVVAPDGASAELTVHSYPPAGISLDRGIRVVTWLPPAHVKAHDPEGNELAAVRLDAPLQPGQAVELGGKHYRVRGEPTWPHRHPVAGTCRGAIDWQHVVLIEDPQPPHLPTPAPARGGGHDGQNGTEAANSASRPVV